MDCDGYLDGKIEKALKDAFMNIDQAVTTDEVRKLWHYILNWWLTFFFVNLWMESFFSKILRALSMLFVIKDFQFNMFFICH